MLCVSLNIACVLELNNHVDDMMIMTIDVKNINLQIKNIKKHVFSVL